MDLISYDLKQMIKGEIDGKGGLLGLRYFSQSHFSDDGKGIVDTVSPITKEGG